MAQEARQTASEWLPAELLPAEPAELRDIADEPVDFTARPGDFAAPVEVGNGVQPQRPDPEWVPSVSPSPGLDLNLATYDQLCRLGLSFHQAAGLIGRREQRGGFSTPNDLDELDGFYGLSREQIETLKQAAGA
jgi:hypothetical protein